MKRHISKFSPLGFLLFQIIIIQSSLPPSFRTFFKSRLKITPSYDIPQTKLNVQKLKYILSKLQCRYNFFFDFFSSSLILINCLSCLPLKMKIFRNCLCKNFRQIKFVWSKWNMRMPFNFLFTFPILITIHPFNLFTPPLVVWFLIFFSAVLFVFYFVIFYLYFSSFFVYGILYYLNITSFMFFLFFFWNLLMYIWLYFILHDICLFLNPNRIIILLLKWISRIYEYEVDDWVYRSQQKCKRINST